MTAPDAGGVPAALLAAETRTMSVKALARQKKTEKKTQGSTPCCRMAQG